MSEQCVVLLGGEPLRGRLVYSEEEYSFGFDIADEVGFAARETGWGMSCLEIETLEIEVDTGSGEAFFVSGLHPRTAWADGRCEPDRLVPGVVCFGGMFDFVSGAGVRVAGVGEWSTIYDRLSGWARVRRPGAPDDGCQVLIASGTALGLCERRLNSVWLRPEFVGGRPPGGRPLGCGDLASLVPVESASAVGDLGGRGSVVCAPDRVWVVGLTYARTSSGWVYVGFVSDAFSRRVLSAAVSAAVGEQLVSDALVLAVAERARCGHPVTSPLLHPGGCGSTGPLVRYARQLRVNGVTPSFGTAGDSPNDALAEAVNGCYQAECVAPDGPFRAVEDVEEATLDWVCWYNTRRRLHGCPGYRTPDEIEQAYYSRRSPLGGQQDTQRINPNPSMSGD